MTPSQREAAERLVDALDAYHTRSEHKEASALLRELLAEPVQEPAIWIQSNHLQHAKTGPYLARTGPTKLMSDFIPLYTHPPQRPQCEPVAWRDHVEHRLRTWRQQHMNRSGDRLALDDFMDKDSIDDLIDFVCDEYAHPPQQREPLTEKWVRSMCKEQWVFETVMKWVRAVERAHGITGEPT